MYKKSYLALGHLAKLVFWSNSTIRNWSFAKLLCFFCLSVFLVIGRSERIERKCKNENSSLDFYMNNFLRCYDMFNFFITSIRQLVNLSIPYIKIVLWNKFKQSCMHEKQNMGKKLKDRACWDFATSYSYCLVLVWLTRSIIMKLKRLTKPLL